jgi:hypothetical protein
MPLKCTSVLYQDDDMTAISVAADNYSMARGWLEKASEGEAVTDAVSTVNCSAY